MNKWTFSIAYFLCAILTTFMFHSWLATEHNEVIAYSDFKRLAHDGKVLNPCCCRRSRCSGFGSTRFAG